MATPKKSAPAKPARKPAEPAAPAVVAPPAAPAKGKLDAAPKTLAKHAEALANAVRANADALASSKVTEADAARLDELAASLRAKEGAWKAARKALGGGAVAALRKPLTKWRHDLYGALEAFAGGDEVAQALAAVGSADDDDDLENDVEKLVAQAHASAAHFADTEITPAWVDRLAAKLKAFRAARKGDRTPEGTTRQALASTARTALAERDAAFWELSALDRLVCLRGRFCFRDDRKRLKDFASYTHERRAAKKAPPAKDAEPEKK